VHPSLSLPQEAEGLCDRLGIFVDGALRCIGNPKELTARFGGSFVLTVSAPGRDAEVAAFVRSALAPEAKVTYALAGTQKFEVTCPRPAPAPPRPPTLAPLQERFDTLSRAFHKPSAKYRPPSSEKCVHDTLSGSLGDVLKSKK
jgi:ABC-type multidrug transport system ATPase subunit